MKFLIDISGVTRKILIVISVLSIQQYAFSQEFESYNNTITFFSEAPLENIEASSQKVYGYLNIKTGEVKATVMIKSFEFEKQLMKEHFNEQYMESHKYPDATFEGKVSDLENLQNRKNNAYKTMGKLTVHGVTKAINVVITLNFDDDIVTGSTQFLVKTADHKIKIPRFVIKNIAEEIEVSVDIKLQ